MIFVQDKGILNEAMDALAAYQKTINDEATYAEQVKKAKTSFKAANVKGNKTFDEIKKGLTDMCCGATRCNYCEDSKADEVEHIKPKQWYPEVCFEWTNYLYACGPCNGPKNDYWAIFVGDNKDYTELNRKKDDPVVAPLTGTDVLINPRLEDPLDFLFLDLTSGQFRFTERHKEDTKEYKREEYTIRILGLNSRAYLAKARALAYDHFINRLAVYVQKKKEGVPQQQLNNMIQNLKEEHHQTVWQEMKRQHTKIQDLNNLFQQAPEALGW